MSEGATDPNKEIKPTSFPFMMRVNSLSIDNSALLSEELLGNIGNNYTPSIISGAGGNQGATVNLPDVSNSTGTGGCFIVNQDTKLFSADRECHGNVPITWKDANGQQCLTVLLRMEWR
jgi:hypothetical protein